MLSCILLHDHGYSLVIMQLVHANTSLLLHAFCFVAVTNLAVAVFKQSCCKIYIP